jgi:hypothetical protein
MKAKNAFESIPSKNEPIFDLLSRFLTCFFATTGGLALPPQVMNNNKCALWCCGHGDN